MSRVNKLILIKRTVTMLAELQRTKFGLTYEALGKLCGISPRQAKRWVAAIKTVPVLKVRTSYWHRKSRVRIIP